MNLTHGEAAELCFTTAHRSQLAGLSVGSPGRSAPPLAEATVVWSEANHKRPSLLETDHGRYKHKKVHLA